VPPPVPDAGALAPVALGYWKNEGPTLRLTRRSPRLAPATLSVFDDAIVRGGRVYL